MILVKPSYEILTPINGREILRFIETTGRVCYKSEDKANADSATRFCRNLLNRQHESVIEHVSMSVKFVVDRGVSHELVRHRLASFSQESTRYCNYGNKGVRFVIPPWLSIPPGEGYTIDATRALAYREAWSWLHALLEAERRYLDLLTEGWSPQQARSVLPNSLKTEIVMTANLREWRHVFKMRCDKAAHPQMREVMIPLLNEVYKNVPVLFDDLFADFAEQHGLTA